MKLKIFPARNLHGTIKIPASKSHTMRSILFASLGRGVSTIHHFLESSDTRHMLQAMQFLGVTMHEYHGRLEIEGLSGSFKAAENVIDAGNSGQILRFVTSFAALMPTYTVITGDASIRKARPIEPLLSGLTQLGGFAKSAKLDGTAPIIVRGPICPGKAHFSGQDSQPVSGLLMACSFLEGTTHLTVDDPGERPWIDLTLSWIHKLGGCVEHAGYHKYRIQGPLRYTGFSTTIPGDLSSAAFPTCAAIVTGSTLNLENVDLTDVQGDKKLFAILTSMGARFILDKKSVTVCICNNLQGMAIDVNDCIDALPILAVLGCFAKGKTELVNASIARKKESDRLMAITHELCKMGAKVEEKPDGLIIHESSLKGAHLSTHGDHRIAMALCVAALGAKGESYLDDVGCIQKSYGSFISDLRQVGASIIDV